MPTPTLFYTPERTSYAADISYGVLETRLPGGPSRKRRDARYEPHYVECQWVLNSVDQYNEFMWYFRYVFADASLPFLMELVTDCAHLTFHRCRTVGGMPRLVRQMNTTYWVQALVEAERNATFLGMQCDGSDNSIATFPILGTQDLEGSILGSDKVRLINMQATHPTLGLISLDGIYDVQNTFVPNEITLDSPGAVNANWTALAGATPTTLSRAAAILTVVPQ